MRGDTTRDDAKTPSRAQTDKHFKIASVYHPNRRKEKALWVMRTIQKALSLSQIRQHLEVAMMSILNIWSPIRGFSEEPRHTYNWPLCYHCSRHQDVKEFCFKIQSRLGEHVWIFEYSQNFGIYKCRLHIALSGY